MYITIMDYGTASVQIIHDEDDVTKGLQTEDVEYLLCKLGYKDSQIAYMVTEDDPYAQDGEYTLRELCNELDEDEQECLQQWINERWTDGTE